MVGAKDTNLSKVEDLVLEEPIESGGVQLFEVPQAIPLPRNGYD